MSTLRVVVRGVPMTANTLTPTFCRICEPLCPLIAETDAGKKIPMGSGRPSLTARGGKGHTLARKAKVVRVTLPEPPPPTTLLN